MLAKHMQRNICGVKCYGIIRCLDNLTERSTSRFTGGPDLITELAELGCRGLKAGRKESLQARMHTLPQVLFSVKNSYMLNFHSCLYRKLSVFSYGII